MYKPGTIIADTAAGFNRNSTNDNKHKRIMISQLIVFSYIYIYNLYIYTVHLKPLINSMRNIKTRKITRIEVKALVTIII